MENCRTGSHSRYDLKYHFVWVTNYRKKVRGGEHRRLVKQGDHRLSRTKYLWLSNHEALSESQHERFDAAYQRQLQTAKGGIQGAATRPLASRHGLRGCRLLQGLVQLVIHTMLAPLKKVARTIKVRLANVVSYCTHGVTNAVAEGINSKITAIKRRV